MTLPFAQKQTQNIPDYFRSLRKSRQWHDWLQALAGELPSLDRGVSETLLRAVGHRLALSAQVPQCQTLGELETAINADFGQKDWGWVLLHEAGTSLRIDLHEPPTLDSEETGGLILVPTLEGFFTTLLRNQGADNSMMARKTAGDWPRLVEFTFGRAERFSMAG